MTTKKKKVPSTSFSNDPVNINPYNKYTQNKTIININSLTTVELNPDANCGSNVVSCQIVKQSFLSDPFELLIDSGAHFSVIKHSLLQDLQSRGLEASVKRSIRKVPVSATGHELEIMGDVILNLQFKTTDGSLELRKVRFTVMKQLSCPCILGNEAIVPLKLRVESAHIILHNKKIVKKHQKTAL